MIDLPYCIPAETVTPAEKTALETLIAMSTAFGNLSKVISASLPSTQNATQNIIGELVGQLETIHEKTVQSLYSSLNDDTVARSRAAMNAIVADAFPLIKGQRSPLAIPMPLEEASKEAPVVKLAEIKSLTDLHQYDGHVVYLERTAGNQPIPALLYSIDEEVMVVLPQTNEWFMLCGRASSDGTRIFNTKTPLQIPFDALAKRIRSACVSTLSQADAFQFTQNPLADREILKVLPEVEKTCHGEAIQVALGSFKAAVYPATAQDGTTLMVVHPENDLMMVMTFDGKILFTGPSEFNHETTIDALPSASQARLLQILRAVVQPDVVEPAQSVPAPVAPAPMKAKAAPVAKKPRKAKAKSKA